MTKKKKIIIGIIIGIILLGIAVFAGIYFYSKNKKIINKPLSNINSEKFECLYPHIKLSLEYKELIPIGGDLLQACKNGKYGIINKKGEEIIECSHENIKIFYNTGNIFIKDNNKWRMLDITGKYLTDNEYDDVEIDIDNFYIVKKDSKKGFIDSKGTEIFPCEYEEIQYVSSEKYVDLTKNFNKGRYSLKDNKWIFNCQYDSLYGQGLFNDRIIIKKGGKFGIYNKLTGEKVIPCIYDEMQYIDGVCWKIKKDDNWGIYNAKEDKEIIPCKYKEIQKQNSFNDYKVWGDYGAKGICDKSGTEIMPCEYKDIIPICNNEYLIEENSGWKIIDKSGISIDGKIYEKVNFEDNVKLKYYMEDIGRVILKCDGKYGLVSKKYNIKIPCIYDQIMGDILEFDNDIIYICKDNKWGIIYNSNIPIIPCEYDEIKTVFYDFDYILVRKGNKWGLIKKTGESIIPIEYDKISYLYLDRYNSYDDREPLFECTKNNKTIIVDSFGQKIIEEEYDEVLGIETTIRNKEVDLEVRDLIIVKKNDKYGIINSYGAQIIPHIYDSIENIIVNDTDNTIFFKNEEAFIVNSNNKFGIIDVKGKEIIPIKYDKIKATAIQGIYIGRIGDELTIIEEKNIEGKFIPNIKIDLDEIHGWYSFLGISDLFKVNRNNKEGVINKRGDIIVPIQYKNIEFIGDDYGTIKFSDEYNNVGMYNKKGVNVVPCKYDSINVFYDKINQIYVAQKGKKYAAYGKNGEMILPCEYDAIHYNEGIITAQNKNGCYIIEYK